MHGPRRVAAFCLLTAVLPTLLIIIPLYLRHSVFADVFYQVAESDIFEIDEGMSSIFCQEHTLEMNTSFNAYQISSQPEMSNNRKHIRLKKSMVLPDDTLEYWGFYLLKGSTVALKVCSRHDGSRILVVRGERNLRTCGLLQHNFNKPHLDKEYKQVRVTFETAAQEIIDTTDKFHIYDPNRRNYINKTKDEADDWNNAAEDQFDDEDQLDDGDQLDAEHQLNNEDQVDQVDAEHQLDNEHQFDNEHQLDAEDQLDKDLKALLNNAETFINKRRNKTKDANTHNKRHAKKRHLDEVKQLEEELNEKPRRKKRETGHKLDGAIEHGGNAINYTKVPSGESNSVSSFETNLLECYDGKILLTESFPPSHLCNDVHYLSRGNHMQLMHDVATDGYYYYIFYSDNDLVSNDIHAIFDIYKPSFQYSNLSDTKKCINNTECNFPVSFFSDETVIVEVPTRDGIEHEEDDITMLVSKCKPRMGVYIIFPITILFLILGCAFL